MISKKLFKLRKLNNRSSYNIYLRKFERIEASEKLIRYALMLKV